MNKRQYVNIFHATRSSYQGPFSIPPYINIYKMKFNLAAIFFFPILVNGQLASSNECTPRTPINVTLPQIDGTWYIAIYVNETNPREQMSCIKMTYKFNATTDMTHEVRNAIHYGETEPEDNSADYGMVSPGLINITYPPDNHIQEQFLQYTPNETFIVSVCQQINGTKTIDRLMMMVKERSMITNGLIRRKLHSIGVHGHRYNTYFRVPQTNCPN